MAQGKKVGDIKRREYRAGLQPESILENEGHTNGVDPYIENLEAPANVPLGLNTEPFDLDKYVGGTGK